MSYSNTIQVPESTLVPVHVILGCSRKDVAKYNKEYILRKIKEYYSR